MSLLSVDELKECIHTNMDDDQLQCLIDAAEDEIDDRCGELASQVDEFRGETLASILLLSRKVDEITTVVEERKSGDEYESTTLETDDYQLRHGNIIIERLASGTNPWRTWGDVVTITYTPVDDTDKRKKATVQLVKLDINYAGMKSEKIGDYSYTMMENYQSERDKIINGLVPWRI